MCKKTYNRSIVISRVGSRVLLLIVAMSWPWVSAAAQTLVTAAQIEAIMNDIAEGRDNAFTQPVAPAWSLNTSSPTAVRIREINARMAHEIERVVTAFVEAPPAEKITATKAVVAEIDPETARDGAAYAFEGSGPSLAIARQLLFVPASGLGAKPIDKVMQISSSFVRSPKTDDTYYEYSDASNLKQSSVIELPGSETSWTTGARPPMASGTVYALKKCRDIFILGWYCNTALYQQRDLPGSGGQVELLLTALYPLPSGADSAKFTDARSSNVADGYSAIYIVVAAGDQILVYNPSFQAKEGGTSLQGMLDEGIKKVYGQLVGLLGTNLGIGKLPY